MYKNFLLSLTVFSLFGCAGVSTTADSALSKGVSRESQVSARAVARWQAMVEKDLDKAYEFLSPGSKAAYPLAMFKGRIRVLDWRPAKVRSASCDDEKCGLKIEITFFNSRLGGEITTVVEETWIKDVGNWWFVFNG